MPPNDILEFDPGTHTYRLSGEVVPSVTQILQDCSLLPWYPDRQFYLNRGRAVHQACALLVSGKLDLKKTDQRLHGYIESFKKFKDRTGFEPHLVEQPVWSSQHRVAGTLDYQGLLNKSSTIIDLKSGEPADAAALQTAAYAVMLKESHGITASRRLTLRLHPDGKECTPEEYHNLSYDAGVFFAASCTWHWRKSMGLVK